MFCLQRFGRRADWMCWMSFKISRSPTTLETTEQKANQKLFCSGKGYFNSPRLWTHHPLFMFKLVFQYSKNKNRKKDPKWIMDIFQSGREFLKSRVEYNKPIPNSEMSDRKMLIDTRPRYPSNKLSFTIADIMNNTSIRFFNIFLNLNEQFDVAVVLEDSQRNLLSSLCLINIYISHKLNI